MVPGWPRFPGTGLVPIFRCFRIALAGLLRAVKTGSQCIRHSIHNAFTGKRSAADRADVSCLFCQNCLNYRGLRFLEKRLIILEGKHRNIRKIAVLHSDLHFYLSQKPFSCARVDTVFVLAFFRTFHFHGSLFGYGFGSREGSQIAHEYRSADYGSGGSACHGAGRIDGQALFGTYGKALHALDAFHGYDSLFLRYGDSHAAGPGTKPAVCAGIALASYFVQPFSGNHSQQCSRGHRYRQKKRPTNREPTAIANSSPNPMVGMAEETWERFPEISIPNTPQGLQEESTGSASTQTPAVIRTNIAYFRYFRMRSNRFGICTFPQTVFLEKKKISSCIIPKEQRNPQKKRPHRAVIRNTMETRSSCGNSPPKEKRPPVSAVNISRTAENTMINNPGYRIKAAA